MGLVGALQSTTYPASAVAVESSTVLEIPERAFFTISDRHPEIMRQVLQMFMPRQAELAQRLKELTLSTEERIAKAFLVLTGDHGFTVPALGRLRTIAKDGGPAE